MTVAITVNANRTTGNDVADIFLRDFPLCFVEISSGPYFTQLDMLIQKVPAAKEILHLERKPFIRINCTQHFPCLEQYVDTCSVFDVKIKLVNVTETIKCSINSLYLFSKNSQEFEKDFRLLHIH